MGGEQQRRRRRRRGCHGRGRPRHLYQATHVALALLFAGNQRLVVPAIWRAIRELGGEDMARKVLKRVSRTLAEHYSSQDRRRICNQWYQTVCHQWRGG